MPTIEESTRDFLASLDEIEFQNITFFILRPSLNDDIRDKLKDHCLFKLQQGKAYFGFIDGSDIPNKIRKRCFSKFLHFFPDGDVIGELFRRN